MNARRCLAVLMSLTVLTGATIALAAQDAPAKTKKAKIGEPAPAFTLKDAEGKAHSLKDYEGKIVVLQWINPDCPVCKGVVRTGKVAKMVEKVNEIDKDAVFLGINSTHYQEAKVGRDYFKKHKLEAMALSDQDGTVGRLYGAKTTPHVFVIDGEGVLRYDGAFDDRKEMNYVVNAVTQIAAGETVTPDTTKPYGCSVKWKKK